MNSPLAALHRGRRALLAAALLAVVAPAAEAAGPATRPGAALRLLVAGVVDGRPLLGLEIALEPGWKTYWRTPGDAGIPPVVDWSKSRGVADFALRFPTPVRFGEEGVQSIGYTAPVILPIDLALADPSKPADLDLDLQLGLCGVICVPVSAHLTGVLVPGAPVDTAVAARLAEARRHLPVPAAEGGTPRVVAVTRDDGAVRVEVAMPEDPDGPRDVLVEGPNADWALPLPERVATAAGRETWRFAVDGLPRGATIEGAELRFTLRAGDRAVEQKVTLDAGATKP
jgi:DsbC/DsbD-like thiol-disulfide interchange protein